MFLYATFKMRYKNRINKIYRPFGVVNENP